MSLFRHSLRRKLILLLTAVSAISVLASCVGLFVYQWKQAYGALIEESYTQAHLLANNSSAALLFNDAKAANETLASLHGESRIKLACLYSHDGNVIGNYVRVNTAGVTCPRLEDARSEMHGNTFHIRQPIEQAGEQVGSLFLDVSLEELHTLLRHFVDVSVAIACTAVLLAFLLSFVMERWISRPILQLTDVAVRISRQDNYALRAKKTSQDEVGLLIDQFNCMLERVEERDVALRSSYDMLEAKVAERTRDLTTEIAERKMVESHLEKARLAAEQSSQAKSSFLANMSHELRTPLNAIIGYSEMLAEDATASDNRESLEDLGKILSSARHLRGIISDILDFSKIEAGQMNFFLETTSANMLLRDVYATAEVLSRNNRNQLRVEPLEEDLLVNVDPLRFRQCLLNLVSNACKFTADGSVTISLRTEEQDGTDYAVWSVKDTGPGIGEEDQKKLFKSFSQVDSSATRKFGGTGLGLAISREFCKAMGASIEVKSMLNFGSTFSIRLPLTGVLTETLA